MYGILISGAAKDRQFSYLIQLIKVCLNCLAQLVVFSVQWQENHQLCKLRPSCTVCNNYRVETSKFVRFLFHCFHCFRDKFSPSIKINVDMQYSRLWAVPLSLSPSSETVNKLRGKKRLHEIPGARCVLLAPCTSHSHFFLAVFFCIFSTTHSLVGLRSGWKCSELEEWDCPWNW